MCLTYLLVFVPAFLRPDVGILFFRATPINTLQAPPTYLSFEGGAEEMATGVPQGRSLFVDPFDRIVLTKPTKSFYLESPADDRAPGTEASANDERKSFYRSSSSKQIRIFD